MDAVIEAVIDPDLVYFILGTGVGWFISWYFYRKGAKDLAGENEHLRRLVDALSRRMEEPHRPFARDEAGAMTGWLETPLQGMSTGTSEATGNLTVPPAPRRRPLWSRIGWRR